MNRKMSLLGATSTAALLLAAMPVHAQTTPRTPPTQTNPSQTTPGQSAAGQTQAPDSAAGTPETNQEPLPQPGDTVEPAAPDQPADEIIVTGLRASVESSQGIKRNADQIVDAIVANDIGKLPDITASASLARIQGVQVNRAAGEAAQVQVRGLPDITTTYNGREIFTAEGRFVQIQDFPAGSVGALEVFKSSTANLIEGGIGGQVNVRSRRPFDFDGFEAFGALNGVYTDQGQEVDFNGNFLVSNRWETGIGEIGVLFNVAYTKLRHLDATREQSFVIGPPPELAATVPFAYPDAQAIYYGAGNRWRPSATATVQWKPTPDFEVYLDGLFQGFRSRDENRFLFNPLFGGGIQFSNVVLQENGRQALSLTATGGLRPDGFTGAVQAKTDTFQGAGGVIWNAGQGVKLLADVAYTDSTFRLSNFGVDHAFASTPVRDVIFDVPRGAGGPSFNFRGFDASDPANFIFRGLFQEELSVGGDDIQARLDIDWETSIDFLPRIQFGARFNDRNAFRQRGDRYQPLEERRIPLNSLPLDFERVVPGFSFDSIQPFRTFAQPTFGSIRNNIAQLRQISGVPEGPVPFAPGQAFDANEKGYTAYGQIKYAFDVGIPIDGLIGVRAIKTKTTVTGTAFIDQGNGASASGEPITRSNEYDDYLPNASLRAVLAEDLQLRLAYTQTRTRPNFIDLNPGGTLARPPAECLPSTVDPTFGPNNPRCIRNFSGGNPNLRPLESTNYDVSLEWYFARAGSLTGALFRRDVNGFISRISGNLAIDPVFGQLRTDRPENGGDGRIQGAEVALAAFLDLPGLPQWTRGFGVQANYTYIDSEVEQSLTLANPNDPTTLQGPQRQPGVSKHAYNLVALYERPKFSARVAYNYRSQWVDGYFRSFYLPTLRDGPVLPLYHEGLGILDFSANVTPVPNITIQFDVNNVLGTPRKLYRPFLTADGDSFPRQVIYLERVFSLGVRFRL